MPLNGAFILNLYIYFLLFSFKCFPTSIHSDHLFLFSFFGPFFLLWFLPDCPVFLYTLALIWTKLLTFSLAVFYFYPYEICLTQHCNHVHSNGRKKWFVLMFWLLPKYSFIERRYYSCEVSRSLNKTGSESYSQISQTNYQLLQRGS